MAVEVSYHQVSLLSDRSHVTSNGKFEALKLLSDLLLARKFMRRSETLGKKSGFDVVGDPTP